MMEPKLVYRGRFRRTSLFLLALSIFFGGLPLIVYFTEKGVKAACLLVGVLMGGGLFSLSVRMLLTQCALVLHPAGRRFQYLRRVWTRGNATDGAYEDVSRVEWDDVSGFPSSACVVLKNGSKLELGEPRSRGDARIVSKLPLEFGVERFVRPYSASGSSGGGVSS